MSSGSIAPNFHEGARSEYLAQYVLSALGTSIMVPRPEDYGIDLFCTLGHRIGQRLHVEDYYCVQVKSNTENVEYKDEKSVKWVTSLSTPLFYCVVDKSKAAVNLYSSIGLCMLSAKKKLNHINLIFKEFPKEISDFNGSIMPCAEHKNEQWADVYLGMPIISFNVSEIHEKKCREKIKSILKKWIEIDQGNINDRTKGYTLYDMPESYATNEQPSKVTHKVGNFLDSFKNKNLSFIHYQSLYKSLSQQINLIANEYDRDTFMILHDSAVKIVERDTKFSSNDSGSASLVAAILCGGKHMNIQVSEIFRDGIDDSDIEVVRI